MHIPAYSTTKLSSTVYEVKEEIADNTNTGHQIKKLENKVESDEFTITRRSQIHNTNNWYQSCHDNSRLMLLLSFDTCSSRQHSAAAVGASRIFYVLVFCANFLQFRPKLTIQLVVEKVLSWAWSATCFDLIELTVFRHLFYFLSVIMV